jgi:hypothetical protein
MIQKLKDWLIVLLGGYSKKEYENQQTILSKRNSICKMEYSSCIKNAIRIKINK